MPQEGIRPIVIPTSEGVAAEKTRVQYEPGHFHFAVAGVTGSGKSMPSEGWRLRLARSQKLGASTPRSKRSPSRPEP
ncbi:hypothetical protein BKA83DRAFT_4059175 [Pisolithus microcarpus]|nr:hypothetical protein BKA83DRAFT_4059175 [Pisolithus microcarpus]